MYQDFLSLNKKAKLGRLKGQLFKVISCYQQHSTNVYVSGFIYFLKVIPSFWFFNYGRVPVNRDWHTSRSTRSIVSETMYSCVDPLTVLRPGHMWKAPISITSTLVQIKLQQLMKYMVYPTYHFSRTLLQRKPDTHAQSRDKMRPPTPQLNSTNLYARSVYQISSKTTEYVCTWVAKPFKTKIKVNDIVARSQYIPSRL
jgi:hypothetical protein